MDVQCLLSNLSPGLPKKQRQRIWIKGITAGLTDCSEEHNNSRRKIFSSLNESIDISNDGVATVF